MKGQVKAPVMVVCECLYCTGTFFAEQGRGAKFCSPSHKELAHRIRKASTANALSGDLNVSQDAAKDMIERMGMARCGTYLRGRGYVYDERLKAWVMPVDNSVNVFREAS